MTGSEIKTPSDKSAAEPMAEQEASPQPLWFNLLPKDSEISDYSIEPLNKLFCIDMPNEFRALTIQTFVDKYALIASEFIELSSRKRELEPSYSKLVMDFIDTMCRVYNFKITPMFVEVNKYAVAMWGAVYWNFMHYSSILLSYAYEHKMVTSFLDFAAIIYNIHLVLPCSLCKGHYLMIRENQTIRECIKYIAFGMPMLGVLYFHNAITDNIDTVQRGGIKRHKPFTYSNFAYTYECITITDETLKSSVRYVPSYFDFQSKTHNALTTILAIYTRQPYVRTSSRLKFVYNDTIAAEHQRYMNRAMYMNQSTFTPDQLTKPYFFEYGKFAVPILQEEDQAFMRMTPKQIKYILTRGLLMQFQNTGYTKESININADLNSALINLYRIQPAMCLELASRNLNDNDPIEKDLKLRITTAINSIQQQQQQHQRNQQK